MNVTVVGGAGYLGSVLCPILSNGRNDSSINLKVVDTFWFWENLYDYKKLFLSNEVELYQSDIRDNLKDILKETDILINLACISNDISSDLDQKFTHSVSYDGVMNVFKTCEELNIKRIIHVSSGSVYGVKEKPVTEETYPEPITQYATIKMELDHYLKHCMKYNDQNITILRPATLYGKSPRQRLDLMLNIFCDKVSKGQPIVVHGGNQSRPSLHVKDLSYTIKKIIDDKRSYNQIYNVSKEAMTVLEYAQIFQNIYGTEIIIENVNDARSWRTNSEKIYRDLEIINKTKLKSGIKELVDYFNNNKIDRNYSVNMTVMKRLLAKGEVYGN